MRTFRLEDGNFDLNIFEKVKPDTFEFKGGIVPYFCGRKGMGKTTLISHIAGTKMLPPTSYDEVFEAQQEAESIGKKIPWYIEHLVYSDISIQTCKDQGYLERKTYALDIEKIGVPSEEDTDVLFLPWGSTLIIDELMEKFDAQDWNKKGSGMPKKLKKFLQICRHRNICIIVGCLLASATNNRFRNMSQNIFLIVERKDEFDNDILVQTTWYCLEFASSALCDNYIESGDIKGAKPVIFTHQGSIWNTVDSYAENEQFLYGMKKRQFDFPRRAS
jgi:energy-coupling factor transporter ATP-binding protein EcfA2